MPARILSVARETDLANLRRLVLESGGFEVGSASSAHEARSMMEDGRWDVLVLCHSMSKESCEEVVGWWRAALPHKPVVMVLRSPWQDPVCDHPERTCLSDDPAQLVAAVRECASFEMDS
jgi:DNA-binding response OmpR family regulator